MNQISIFDNRNKMYFILTLILLTSSLLPKSFISNAEFEKTISSISAIEALKNDTTDISQIINAYHTDIEYALTWRVRAVKTYQSLYKKEVLMGADIDYLNYATHRYKQLRENLYGVIFNTAPLTNENVIIEINDELPTLLEKKSKYNQILWSSNHEYIRINPNDIDGQDIIKKIKLAVVCALLLYDNYLISIAPFEENSKLRFIINEDGVEPEVSGYLSNISESYTDKDKLKRMGRIIKLTSEIQKWEKTNTNSNLVKEDPDNKFLNILINGSPSYSDFQIKDVKGSRFRISFDRFNIFKNKIEDKIKKIGNNATHYTSKLFGNTAGLIATREGKMNSLSYGEKNYIQSKLQPLDILLEKAPFRLTDHLIPGYWSHVGLWCGNKSELEKLGVWDELPKLYDNAVLKYNYSGPNFQELINNGHFIIEALRPGVQLNTLNKFLNIDDIGVIRHDKLTAKQKKQYLINAFNQIGKNYDFNFNVESSNEIVCSELIYIALNDIEWNTKKTIGRYTISPDNVAQKLKGSNFKPILLYIDGKEIDQNIKQMFPTN